MIGRVTFGFVCGVSVTLFVGYQVHRGIQQAKERIEDFKADLHEMPMIGGYFQEKWPLEPMANHQTKRFLDFETAPIGNNTPIASCITIAAQNQDPIGLRCNKSQTLFAPVSGTLSKVDGHPGQYDFASPDLPTVRIRFANLAGARQGTLAENQAIAQVSGDQPATIAVYQFDGTRWQPAPTPRPLIEALIAGTQGGNI